LPVRVTSRSPGSEMTCVFLTYSSFLPSFLRCRADSAELGKDHTTRAYIIANDASSPLPNAWSDGIRERNALIRLEVLQDCSESQGRRAPVTVTISGLLAALDLAVVRIDRRPSTSGPREQFGSVYFVEVMDTEGLDSSQPSSQQTARVGNASTGLSPWKGRVIDAVRRVVESGGCADLLGTW